MLSSSTSLLSILLLLSISASGQGLPVSDSSRSDYEFVFKQLSKYLSKELPGNDDGEAFANANVEKAKEWIRSDPIVGSDVVSRRAVELFTSLSKVLKGDKCSKENLDILIAIDRETGGKNRAVNDVSAIKTCPKSRVDQVIDFFATKHAKVCQDEYRYRYDSKYAQMDSEKLKRVQELLDQVIVMSYFHKSRVYGIKRLNRLYNDIIMQQDPIKGVESARAYYIVMGDLTENQPEESKYLSRVLDPVNGGKSVHSDEIRKLFTKYLIEPCQYYVAEMGPNIFVPAKIEASWAHEIKESEHDYYYGWARYRFCESFLKSDHESLLKGVVKLAEMS